MSHFKKNTKLTLSLCFFAVSILLLIWVSLHFHEEALHADDLFTMENESHWSNSLQKILSVNQFSKRIEKIEEASTKANVPFHAGADNKSELERIKEIKSLSQQIGKTDEHPDETERKLTYLASHLKEDEILRLEKVVLNTDDDGDFRSMAAYLLSKSQGQLVQEALKNILLSEISTLDSKTGKPKDNHMISFESTLKTLAVEGLQNQSDKKAAKSILKSVLEKTSDAIVQDRTQRALLYLDGQAPDIQDQELKALRKVSK